MPDKEKDLERKAKLNNIISDYYDRRAKEELRNNQKKAYNLSFSISRSVFRKLGLILIIGLAFHLVISAIEETLLFSEPQYWAKGERKGGDYKVNGCIFRLWQVRKAVDSYYVEHRTYPETIIKLYRQGYLHDAIVCPISGEKYILKEINGKQSFCCPNPGEHNVGELFAPIGGGAPEIKR